MLEIALLWFLTKLIGQIVEDKGHASGRYKVLAVVLWFGGEFIGALLGLSLASASASTQCSLYMFALLGAAAGAGLAYLIASNLAPVPSVSSPAAPSTAGAQAGSSEFAGSHPSAVAVSEAPGKVSVYKRFSNGPGNAEIVEGQDPGDDSTNFRVRLIDSGVVGPDYAFQCPWCEKSYTAQAADRSLLLNCVKCGQQMMVATDG